ncbi:hypothetical protein ACE1TI_12635 [Alteribacillus sp. JSM 102045]|uniref:hypothetical protein n=1 Tax=Alteribacillus sp. JSM 102045 TaxID=1562101 RepID=UPI0035C21A3D
MDNKPDTLFSSPFLKEEADNSNSTKSDEQSEKKPINRDPWNELLFGRQPEPSNAEDDDNEENETKESSRPKFSWF